MTNAVNVLLLGRVHNVQSIWGRVLIEEIQYTT